MIKMVAHERFVKDVAHEPFHPSLHKVPIAAAPLHLLMHPLLVLPAIVVPPPLVLTPAS
jgi:hypothetical protein